MCPYEEYIEPPIEPPVDPTTALKADILVALQAQIDNVTNTETYWDNTYKDGHIPKGLYNIIQINLRTRRENLTTIYNSINDNLTDPP